ncbi:MAG TPA: ATP-binding protein [Planktothrix sp.]|jgi:predicted ATPase
MRAVITGGPSVGKTTIISHLSQRGFKVVEEFATQVIKEGQYLPWLDRSSFQSEVLRRQVAAETAIAKYPGPVFLDRGLFDGEAYYIHDKIEIPAAFSKLDASQYSMAFLIEELDFFEQNDVRRENLEFTRQISRVLESCYRRRNVPVIRVPAMPPGERVQFVIDQFEKHCLVQAKCRMSVIGNPLSVPAMIPAYAV